jgi:hypothetical protein
MTLIPMTALGLGAGLHPALYLVLCSHRGW